MGEVMARPVPQIAFGDVVRLLVPGLATEDVGIVRDVSDSGPGAPSPPSWQLIVTYRDLSGNLDTSVVSVDDCEVDDSLRELAVRLRLETSD